MFGLGHRPRLTACSGLISSNDERKLTRFGAYHNCGIAFREFQEFDHAKLDFGKALDTEAK